MTKLIPHLIILLLLLLSRQVVGGNTGNPSGVAMEKVVLITDRSVYITGERVHFAASLFTQGDSTLQSRVLYLELITPEGNKLVGNKYSIVSNSAEGCIPLAADLVSGIYYLRAYTKVMRNYGPETYAYRQIWIVNPGNNEVLANENLPDTPVTQNNDSVEDSQPGAFSLAIGKSGIRSRDTVVLTVKPAKVDIEAIERLCLSVVPETTESSLFSPLLPHKAQPANEAGYYSESRGLSLTGKLTENASRLPVPGKRINLSVIGEGRDFMAVRTDSTGHFYFSLPEYDGSRDLFLCSESTRATDYKIWIDNDFCSMPVRLPTPAFVLSEKERNVLLNMAQNVQISSHFQPDTLQDTGNVISAQNAFYGKPTSIIYLDQYIQLPTLEEYFNEIPGMVRVRKRNGEKYFKVTGTGDVSFYDPLVLVDWVAIDEPAKILAVLPRNILRIEVVNQLYVKGGQTYGGIISIISKKGDFAGIDLPSTGIFVNYRFLSGNDCAEKFNPGLPGHPDARNTLLWEPALTISEGADNKFSFTAPDTPGVYSIVLEGITKQGAEIREILKFEVRH